MHRGNACGVETFMVIWLSLPATALGKQTNKRRYKRCLPATADDDDAVWADVDVGFRLWSKAWDMRPKYIWNFVVNFSTNGKCRYFAVLSEPKEIFCRFFVDKLIFIVSTKPIEWVQIEEIDRIPALEIILIRFSPKSTFSTQKNVRCAVDWN